MKNDLYSLTLLFPNSFCFEFMVTLKRIKKKRHSFSTNYKRKTELFQLNYVSRQCTNSAEVVIFQNRVHFHEINSIFLFINYLA